MIHGESAQRLLEKGRFRLSAIGVGLACAYVVLTPVMLQDSFHPVLPGFLAGAQLTDLLAPLLFVWALLDALHPLPVEAPIRESPVWHAALVGFVLANTLVPLAGFAMQQDFDPGTPLKQGYLALVLLVFARISRIPKASLVILWTSLLTLLIATAFSAAVYATYAVSGRGEFAVEEGTQLMLFGRPIGALLGPMKPTPKLFGTYLFVMQLALFIGRRHLGRRLCGILSVLVLICGILTFTRPGLYAACCVVASYGLRSRTAALRCMWLPSVIAVASIATITSVCDVNFIGRTSTDETCPTTALVHLKYTALETWLESPVLGPGLTTFSEAWSETGDRLPGHLVGKFARTPNCSYLHVLLTSGFLGLAGWLGLLGLPLIHLWHRRPAREDRRFLSLWVVLFGLVMLDLTIVHFRFLYFLIPILPLIPLTTLPAPPRDDL